MSPKKFLRIIALSVVTFSHVVLALTVNAMEEVQDLEVKRGIWSMPPNVRMSLNETNDVPWSIIEQFSPLARVFGEGRAIPMELCDLIWGEFSIHFGTWNTHDMENELEHSACTKSVSWINKGLEPVKTRLPLNLINWLLNTLSDDSLLIAFFKDLRRFAQPQHINAYRTFVAFLELPTKQELSISPYVHASAREPNKSLEDSESDSHDTIKLKDFIFSDKKIVEQKSNDETESNQDTNGTTGPKHDLKIETNIEPSSILAHSNSSHSQEGINNSTIISDIQSPTFLIPKSLFKSLLHNHGNCNVGTTSEKDSISLEASDKIKFIELPRSHNSVTLQKIEEYPHVKSKSEEGRPKKLKNSESDQEKNPFSEN